MKQIFVGLAAMLLTTGAMAAAPAWQVDAVYNAGAVVSHAGQTYTAKWWTQNEVPGAAWGAWALVPVAGEDAVWQATVAYVKGQQVVHGTNRYEAKWWTQGEEPGSNEWGAWTLLGPVTKTDLPLTGVRWQLGQNASHTTALNWYSDLLHPVPGGPFPSALIPGTDTGTDHWEVWAGGQLVYRSEAISRNRQAYPCDPVYDPRTGQSRGCENPPLLQDAVLGRGTLYLGAGLSTLTLRLCDGPTQQCYVSAPFNWQVDVAPVVPLPPPKPAFTVVLSKNQWGQTEASTEYRTPLISDPRALATGIKVVRLGPPEQGVLWGNAKTLIETQGCPPGPNGEAVAECYYQRERNPDTDLPITPFIVSEPGSYRLLLCNREDGDQCTASDPIHIAPLP